jgi:Flp pilus assembly pilin Flp
MTLRGPLALARDRDGAAAVEFAIVAPLTLLMATVGYAGVTLHAGALSLETGVAAAARRAVIGERGGGTTRMAEIRSVVTEHVCPPGGGFCYWTSDWMGASDDGEISPLRILSSAYVDPRNIGRPEPFADLPPYDGRWNEPEVYDDVNENGVWDHDMGAALAGSATRAAGGSGDHVVYRVTFAQSVAHPLLKPVLGDFVLREARIVVRNEPF